MRFRGLFNKLLQGILFPQVCILCRRPVLNEDFSPLCQDCRQDFRPIGPRRCDQCGIPVPGNILETFCVCSRCRECGNRFDWCRAWGGYEGSLRKTIRKFKFDGFRQLAGPLSQLLDQAFRTSGVDEEFDCIIPVPSHPKRLRQRGFDHTGRLAARLSKRLRIPCFKGLRRSLHTRPQSGLDKEERRRNLRGAFSLRNGARLDGSNVLLVDDILTTGATANEASRQLRSEAAVKKILVLVVARRLLATEN